MYNTTLKLTLYVISNSLYKQTKYPRSMSEFRCCISNCIVIFNFPFTDDTIFTILPLAEDYQVSEVKERCKHLITLTLQTAINHEIERPDLHILLKYISYAKLYNMASVLPLAVTMCAKYTITSLTEASLHTPVSENTLVKICSERGKIMETLAEERIKKGNNLVFESVNHR